METPKDIPEKCKNCPVLSENTRFIDAAESFTDHLIRVSVSSELDDKVAEFINQIHEDYPGHPLSDMTPGEVASGLREMGGETMTEIRSDAERLKQSMANYAMDCKGPLTMRATPDNRREYTVTICTSPQASTGSETESAVVKRTKL